MHHVSIRTVRLNLSMCVTLLFLLVGCDKHSNQETLSAPPPPLPSSVVESAEPSPVTNTANSSAQSLKCPEAPRQLDKDIIIDAKGKIEGLASLTGASIEGKISAITKDFISKYPNADKLLAAQLLMSVTCEALKVSQTITDKERLDRISSANTQIITMFTTNSAPDFRARASHVDFATHLGHVVSRKMILSEKRSPTLYIFDPDCKVVVYIDAVLPRGVDSEYTHLDIPDPHFVASSGEVFKYKFSADDPLFTKTMGWYIDDSHYEMKGPGTVTEVMQNEARRGLQLISQREFEAEVVMRNIDEGKCEGSYYIDTED